MNGPDDSRWVEDDRCADGTYWFWCEDAGDGGPMESLMGLTMDSGIVLDRYGNMSIRTEGSLP